MRIRPYKNLDNRIDGAVLTFLDIDAMKRNAAAQDQSVAILDAMTRVATTPVVVLDSELRVREASRAFYRQFKLSPQEAVGQPFYALADGGWDSPRVRSLLEDLISRETRVEEYAVLLQDGTNWVLNAVAVGDHGDHGRFIIMSCTESKASPAN
jgi:two-component system CheB/CheR fusion protein